MSGWVLTTSCRMAVVRIDSSRAKDFEEPGLKNVATIRSHSSLFDWARSRSGHVGPVSVELLSSVADVSGGGEYEVEMEYGDAGHEGVGGSKSTGGTDSDSIMMDP